MICKRANQPHGIAPQKTMDDYYMPYIQWWLSLGLCLLKEDKGMLVWIWTTCCAAGCFLQRKILLHNIVQMPYKN